MQTQFVTGCLLALGIAGCAHTPGVVPEPFDPIVTTQACQDKPPVYIEVPTPVAMPCQLKPAVLPMATSAAPKGKRGKGAQRVALTNAEARQGPETADGVNAIQAFTYMPGALYQVYAGVKQVTTLLFQPGEKIMSFVAGDTERWEVAKTEGGSANGKQEMLVLKPQVERITTNLTVTTSKRLYLIELRSTDGSTYHAAISWSYPADNPLTVNKTAEMAEEKMPVSIQATPDKLNFAYTITQVKGRGKVAWMPMQAFDDGTKLYIRMPESMRTDEAPVLFVRSAEQATQLVNYRVRNGFYVVDRLADEFEMRVGENHPAIVRITRMKPVL